MTKNKILFEEIVLGIESGSLGNLFGKDCGKIGKKAFVAFFEDEMVFKIGKEEVNLLLQKYEGAQRWDPSGKDRAMKDWIQVPGEYSDDWKQLALNAVEFSV